MATTTNSEINLISPTVFDTGFLIADQVSLITNHGPYGSTSQSIAQTLTRINGLPIAAALELQSIQGGFVPPRMTQTQITAIADNTANVPIDSGTMVFNKTIEALQVYVIGTGFETITAGGAEGNVVSDSIPAGDGNIVVYNGTSGTHVRDSTVNIEPTPPLGFVSSRTLGGVNVNTTTGPYLTNVGYIGFNSDVAPIVVNGLTNLTFINNTASFGTLSCALFSGGNIGPTSSSVNALVELQTDAGEPGALLLSRVTQTDITNNLTNPVHGMVLFNSSINAFQGYYGSAFNSFVALGNTVAAGNYQFAAIGLTSTGVIATIASQGYEAQGNNILILGTHAGNPTPADNGVSNLIVGVNNSYNADFVGINNTILGCDFIAPSITTGSNNVLIGQQAANSIEDGSGNIIIGAVGMSAGVGNGIVSGNQNIIMGQSSGNAGDFSNAIMIGTLVNTASYGIGIGKNLTISSSNGTAIGSNCSLNGTYNGLAIGNTITINSNNSIVIGNNVTSTQDNSMILGGAFTSSGGYAQGLAVQVVIGGATPTISAILDLSAANTMALLLPITTDIASAVISPSEGMIAYDSLITSVCAFQGGEWVPLGTSGSGSVTEVGAINGLTTDVGSNAPITTIGNIGMLPAAGPEDGLFYALTGTILDGSNNQTAFANFGFMQYTPGTNDYNIFIATDAIQGNITGDGNIGIGCNLASLSNEASIVCIGMGADTTGSTNAVIIGGTTTAINCPQAVVIGYGSSVTGGVNGVAIGSGAIGSDQAFAIGTGAAANNTFSTAIGFIAVTNATRAVAIGCLSTASGVQSVAIGNQTNVADAFSVVIGSMCTTTGATNAVVIGQGSNASANYGIVIGSLASSTAADGIAIGQGTTASNANSVALGAGSATTFDNQVMLGTSGGFVTMPGGVTYNVTINSGTLTLSPENYYIFNNGSVFVNIPNTSTFPDGSAFVIKALTGNTVTITCDTGQNIEGTVGRVTSLVGPAVLRIINIGAGSNTWYQW